MLNSAALATEPITAPAEPATPSRSWDQILAPYKKADDRVALFQLSSTAALFALAWWAMLLSLETSYWLTLLIALPAAGLSIRLFIFQHDCGHGSFFTSRRANNLVGTVLGVITLNPYFYWRRTHAIHHATSGDLDRREYGDVTTLTVKEYLALPWHRRLGYRLYRSMAVMLLIGPFYQFVLKSRLPFDIPLSWKQEWRSIFVTNLALAAIVAVAWRTIGLERFLLVQGPITLISGTIGIWLFYVQHQFEDTYWEHHERWSFQAAGLSGSSFYDLPPIIHWFTGNICFHHIHHLSSLIPNYRLQACMRENAELQRVTRLTFWSSLGCARLKLWDEDARKLVGFSHLKQLLARPAAEPA